MDSPRPLTSVVIPCYNQGRYLADAIHSVASCTFPTQIVVVDDGSTDNSADVALGFSEVTFVQQENRGLARARNRGLDSAIGDFVVFLDADDRLLPGGLDVGISSLIAHPECAMTYGRCVMMGEDGAFWPTPEQAVVLSDHYGSLLRTNPIWMPAMAIFRREAVTEAGGFHSGFDAAADYDLYLRIAAKCAIHDHGHPVAAYRRHSSSMSGNAARMLRDTLTVMRRNRGAAIESGRLDAWQRGYRAWQDFYGTMLVEEIRTHLHAGEFPAFVRKLLILAWLAPWVCARELRRTMRRRYAGRAIPAAEISAPSRRAEI